VVERRRRSENQAVTAGRRASGEDRRARDELLRSDAAAVQRYGCLRLCVQKCSTCYASVYVDYANPHEAMGEVSYTIRSCVQRQQAESPGGRWLQVHLQSHVLRDKTTGEAKEEVVSARRAEAQRRPARHNALVGSLSRCEMRSD